MTKAVEQPAHLSSAGAAELDPELLRIGRIEPARNQSSLLKHRRPARDCRPWSSDLDVVEPHPFATEPGGEKLKQDIPGNIPEQFGAECLCPSATQCQDRGNLLLGSVERLYIHRRS